MDIQDYRCNISMVHVTDMKKTTLMEQVAGDYEQLGKQGRFSKKCIPRGYIPDLDWTTVHEDLDQPIKPVKQQEDPTETTTIPAAPSEVEGPPSSHPKLSSKQRPSSRIHRNAIHPEWTHQNAIQLKQRLMKYKLHQKAIPYTYSLMGQESLKT